MQKTLTQQPTQPLPQHLCMQKPMRLPVHNPYLQNQNPSCDEEFLNNLDAVLVPVLINQIKSGFVIHNAENWPTF